MNQISEQDELLLNRLLDGDLAADEAARLQERLVREPALRDAMNALMRINTLLVDRGGEQPDINWRQFRQDVLDQIGQEAHRGKTLRFTRWVWTAAPLAAAAIIALVVMTYHPTRSPKVAMPLAERKMVIPNAVQPETGVLAVRYNQPSPARNSEILRVSYTQSPQLAEAVQKRDHDSNSQPTAHLYIAERSQRPNIVRASLDLPPL